MLAAAALPVVLTAAALIFYKLGKRPGVWVCAALLLALCVLTGFSIGFVFLPAAMTLVVSAALGQVEALNDRG